MKLIKIHIIILRAHLKTTQTVMLNLFQHLLSHLKQRFRIKFGMTKQFLEVPLILAIFVSVNAKSFSQTLLQTDSITNNIIDKYKILCGGMASLPIIGSIPTGVGPTVQYHWEKNLDSLTNNWQITSLNDTSPNYQPPNPGYLQMFYRRIVISNSMQNASNICVVKVFPGSTNLTLNQIGPNLQNVHYGVIPATFSGTPITGGTLNDTIKYIWLKSQSPSFNITYPAIEGTYKSQNLAFNEGADTTFYYDRFAYILLPTLELACISYSNSVKVYLLDSNVISCSDTVFCNVANSILITGNSANHYTYQWHIFNGTSWVPIPGATNYQYSQSSLTNTTKFLRMVKDTISGYTSNSNIITIHVTPAITNDTIWNHTPNICKGISGPILYGSNPLGGNNTYQYSWWYSNNQINWTPNTLPTTTIIYFQAPALDNTTYYIRIITSGPCIDTSNVVTVTPIIVHAIADSSIKTCGNNATLTATPPPIGGSGWWEVPHAFTLSPPDSTLIVVNAVIAPFTANNITFPVVWHVQNAGCKSTANVAVTFFHPVGPANAGTDITLIGVDSVRLNAVPQSFMPGYWSIISGGGTFANNTDATTIANLIPQGENIFRWTVTNGPCVSQFDDVTVTVTNLKIPKGFSPNGDGVNDFFEIKGIEYYPKSDFIVFNRWGIEVYHKQGYDNTWDGKTMNKVLLPEDTYFYILKLDEKNSRKGFIILKR